MAAAHLKPHFDSAIIAVFTLVQNVKLYFLAKIAGHIDAARGAPEQNEAYYYGGAEWGFL